VAATVRASSAVAGVVTATVKAARAVEVEDCDVGVDADSPVCEVADVVDTVSKKVK
jgi:hypothetical protein